MAKFIISPISPNKSAPIICRFTVSSKPPVSVTKLKTKSIKQGDVGNIIKGMIEGTDELEGEELTEGAELKEGETPMEGAELKGAELTEGEELTEDNDEDFIKEFDKGNMKHTVWSKNNRSPLSYPQ